MNPLQAWLATSIDLKRKGMEWNGSNFNQSNCPVNCVVEFHFGDWNRFGTKSDKMEILILVHEILTESNFQKSSLGIMS